MDSSEITQSTSNYQVWLSNENFGVATAAFLLIAGMVLIGTYIRSVANKLDRLEEGIVELSITYKTGINLMKDMARIIYTGKGKINGEDSNDSNSS